jgi:hypothetical protein
MGPAEPTDSFVDEGNTLPEQSGQGQWTSGTQGMHAEERPGRTTSTETEEGLVALEPLTLDKGGKADEGSCTPPLGHSLSPGLIIQVGQQQPAGDRGSLAGQGLTMPNASDSMRALEDHSSEGGLTVTTEVRDQCATTLGSEDTVSSTMEEDDQEPTAGVLQAPEMLASDQGLREGGDDWLIGVEIIHHRPKQSTRGGPKGGRGNGSGRGEKVASKHPRLSHTQ